MSIYTRDKAVIRKLDTLVADYPHTYKPTGQDEVSKTYSFTKSHVSYRKPRIVCMIWHSDDITTAVYSFWSEIHTYDGNVIKTYDLAEDSHIYDLAFCDNYAKLDVTIAHDDGTETDTIALPGK